MMHIHCLDAVILIDLYRFSSNLILPWQHAFYHWTNWRGESCVTNATKTRWNYGMYLNEDDLNTDLNSNTNLDADASVPSESDASNNSDDHPQHDFIPLQSTWSKGIQAMMMKSPLPPNKRGSKGFVACPWEELGVTWRKQSYVTVVSTCDVVEYFGCLVCKFARVWREIFVLCVHKQLRILDKEKSNYHTPIVGQYFDNHSMNYNGTYFNVNEVIVDIHAQKCQNIKGV